MEDRLQAYVAGGLSALQTQYAVLVDELVKAKAFDPASLKDRLSYLAKALETDPDQRNPIRDESIAKQLRHCLSMLEGPPGPGWTPVVVQGGLGEGPSES